MVLEAGGHRAVPRLCGYTSSEALGASVSLIAPRGCPPSGTLCQQMDIWKLLWEGSECPASPQALAGEARVRLLSEVIGSRAVVTCPAFPPPRPVQQKA